MERAVEGIVDLLRREVGEEHCCLYLYGSRGQPTYQPGHSDTNLLAIMSEEVDLLALRAAFLPLWAEHGEALRRPPAFAHAAAVARHRQLAPVLAEKLDDEGRRLWGALPLDWPPHGASPLARTAHLAHEALLGSAALAPQLLADAEAEAAYRRLHRLARQLTGSALRGMPPASILFARVHCLLRRQLSAALGQDEPQEIARASAPNLEGVYTETNRLIVLLPPLSEALLMELDWAAIAGRLTSLHTILQATTGQQLALIQEYETALGFALGRHQHQWGSAPLDGLTAPLRAVLQEAGRTSSQLLVEELAGDYLTTTDDEALHRVVHDYQNRLLNLRLQHELLHRLHGLAAVAPPYPLPGRGAPVAERVAAIMAHLDWWAAHYTALWEQTPADVRVVAW